MTQLLKPMFGTIRSASSPKGIALLAVRALLHAKQKNLVLINFYYCRTNLQKKKTLMTRTISRTMPLLTLLQLQPLLRPHTFLKYVTV
jgi:hypothetical protein